MVATCLVICVNLFWRANSSAEKGLVRGLQICEVKRVPYICLKMISECLQTLPLKDWKGASSLIFDIMVDVRPRREMYNLTIYYVLFIWQFGYFVPNATSGFLRKPLYGIKRAKTPFCLSTESKKVIMLPLQLVYLFMG